MVTVDGFDVATQPADVRESISLTGQFAAVDEILTGRENLVLVARLRHLKGTGQIADDLLARFQLTDAAGRRVSTYSGRHAPPPGHHHEPHRESAGDLPGRTDHRARPAVSRRSAEQRQRTRRAGHDGAAHHAVPGRGRTPRRPDRDLAPGTDHRERHPRRTANGSTRPPQVEYVEKQPTLEDVFLAIIGHDGNGSSDSGLATTPRTP